MPLYVLTAKTLAMNMRETPLINGVPPPNLNAKEKLSQFADDTTLVLIDDKSITESFRHLTNMSKPRVQR